MKSDFGQIALVFLAAGHSRRFGKPKLSEILNGKMLAHHAASTLSAIPFASKLAVVGNDDLRLADFGFNLVRVPATTQSESLVAGVTAALKLQPKAIMIALADMPFVPLIHFMQLAEAFDGNCIASSNGLKPMPPAIFGRTHFSALGQLHGDVGARSLLRQAPQIVADVDALLDIDTPEQLSAVNQRWLAK
jgi:molybdenum cofactor cytidylyltransferase